MRLNPALIGLACFSCQTPHDPRQLQTVCRSCGLPLSVDYALTPETLPLAKLRGRAPSLWRYAEVLPIASEDAVTLSEGFTPLLEVAASRKPQAAGRLFIKDESRNPTGSFKARGLCLAVTMAKALGARALQAPSAGNAAGALAAYGAAAQLPVTVAMPDDTPRAFIDECRLYGARVELVKGTIADAGKWLKANGDPSAFDVSTLKEPYRIEGKKTMAYELYEQLEGDLPQVIFYPTGGGTGLVGMWKAFREMRALGWPLPRLPRFVSVQAAGCAPVVKGFAAHAEKTEPWQDAHTAAYGLRVPSPIGGFLCLRALYETGGTAVAVPEEQIGPATEELARMSGIDVCPEGGAAWAALRTLRASGWVKEGESVVVFNTGTGLKYR